MLWNHCIDAKFWKHGKVLPGNWRVITLGCDSLEYCLDIMEETPALMGWFLNNSGRSVIWGQDIQKEENEIQRPELHSATVCWAPWGQILKLAGLSFPNYTLPSFGLDALSDSGFLRNSSPFLHGRQRRWTRWFRKSSVWEFHDLKFSDLFWDDSQSTGGLAGHSPAQGGSSQWS